MKAITCAQYGPPDELRLCEVPEPKLSPDQVLVRVKAAGVNPIDWMVVAGYTDSIMNISFPLIPGWDVAGVVERVGPAVWEFEPGDEVMGYVRKDEIQFGTYAELVAAPVRTLARKPSQLSWHQAAGLPLAGLTALQCLDLSGAAHGDTLLVHAAAGGVGSLGVQLAVARGMRVIGTAGEGNHEFLRGLGVEPVVYGDGLAGRVRELAPEGIDVALDFIGKGDAVAVSQKVLKDPSRFVSIMDFDAASVGGVYHLVRPDSAGLTELGRLAAAGTLVVHVNAVLPLAEAAEALRLSQTGHTRGKLVLDVS